MKLAINQKNDDVINYQNDVIVIFFNVIEFFFSSLKSGPSFTSLELSIEMSIFIYKGFEQKSRNWQNPVWIKSKICGLEQFRDTKFNLIVSSKKILNTTD